MKKLLLIKKIRMDSLKDLTLIIFTNSDYHYLWNVIDDYINKIDSTYLKKILCYNDNYSSNNSSNLEFPKKFDDYIPYNGNINYSKRWIEILPKITTSHILIVHDIDIILNLDLDKLAIFFNMVKYHNIDRLSLSLFLGSEIINSELSNNSNMNNNKYYICNLKNVVNTRHYVPYDVSPSIWNKNTFLQLISLFPNETYASSEQNQNLQFYCRNNLKCYGIHTFADNTCYYPKYCRGLVYSNIFQFLHITTKSQLLLPYEIYMDCKTELLEILKKYNLENKISKNYDCKFVIDQFKPLY
jgi:hypothetical protein